MKNWLTTLCKTFAEKSNSTLNEKSSIEQSFGDFTKLNSYDAQVLIAVCLFSQRRKPPYISDITSFLSEKIDETISEKIIERLISSGWIDVGTGGPFGGQEFICLSQAAEQGLKKSKQDLLPSFQSKLKNKTLRTIITTACSAKRGVISRFEWNEFVFSILRKPRSKFLIELKKCKFAFDEASLLLLATGLFFSRGEEIELDECLDFFFSDKLELIKFKSTFSNSHPLVAQNYLDIDSDYRNSKSIKLANHWMSLCLGINIQKQTKEHSAWSRIKCNEIVTRELCYNQEIHNNFETWKNLFNIEGYNRFAELTRKRKELSGITVLLSGPPGTGKTEMCKQLAKESGRDLLLFEVSQGRDKFFGESEKIIKGVFSAYRQIVQTEKEFPILLFNEGDSIFQKRKEGSSVAAQTENIIQTILLNELEVFEGILMVTTNIPDSFDPAFDRRFLFKQNIALPNQLVREQLLKNYFPKLSSSFIKDLSMNYVFSAAELINFKRQVSIQLLTSNLPENEITEQGIELFLSNGKSKLNRNPIGFKY